MQSVWFSRQIMSCLWKDVTKSWMRLRSTRNVRGWLQLTSQSLKICLAVISKMPAPKLTPLPNSEQTLRSQLKEDFFSRGQKKKKTKQRAVWCMDLFNLWIQGWIRLVDRKYWIFFLISDHLWPSDWNEDGRFHRGMGSKLASRRSRWQVVRFRTRPTINALEIMAIESALKCFEKHLIHKHVKILTANTCAESYLRNMGGSHSVKCNDIAHRVRVWCKSRGIWLTVSHIPGKSNVEADTRSRIFNDRTEWQLNPYIFERSTKRFGTPDVDLFASRLNYQIKPFVSWGPDPESWAVDAFSINWGNTYSYAFPPFSLLNRVLNKLRRDQADGLVIAPYWTTASWFPVLVDMLTSPPVLLPQGSRVLRLPHNNAVHPLHRQLQLMACNLSGKPSKQKEFVDRCSTSYGRPGDQQLRHNMPLISQDGVFSVVRGVIIPFVRL